MGLRVNSDEDKTIINTRRQRPHLLGLEIFYDSLRCMSTIVKQSLENLADSSSLKERCEACPIGKNWEEVRLEKRESFMATSDSVDEFTLRELER